MLEKLKARVRSEEFLPSPLAIALSPLYIVRNGLFKAISNAAPEIRGDVLDFGCGSKPYESLFTGVQSYVGVDIEVSGHDHKNSKIDFFYDGKVLPFADKTFDAIVSFEVFEHVFNLDEVLDEIRRVLRPDGLLLISIPFAWFEHEVPFDFARYTSFGITHVLARNGFEVTQLQKTTTFILSICQLFIDYLAQFVLPRGRGLGRKSFWVVRASQIVCMTVLNTSALALNALLPKKYDCFCSCVVLSRKIRD